MSLVKKKEPRKAHIRMPSSSSKPKLVGKDCSEITARSSQDTISPHIKDMQKNLANSMKTKKTWNEERKEGKRINTALSKETVGVFNQNNSDSKVKG